MMANLLEHEVHKISERYSGSTIQAVHDIIRHFEKFARQIDSEHDFVDVVRCKDCEYAYPSDDFDNALSCSVIHGCHVWPNGYCNNGMKYIQQAGEYNWRDFYGRK